MKTYMGIWRVKHRCHATPVIATVATAQGALDNWNLSEDHRNITSISQSDASACMQQFLSATILHSPERGSTNSHKIILFQSAFSVCPVCY